MAVSLRARFPQRLLHRLRGWIVLGATGGLLGASLGVLAPGTATAQPSTSSDAFNSLTAQSHPEWMGGASSQVSLGSLSIPGTHDTLAIHGGWLAPSAYEAQENHGDSSATLTAQLNAGIRAIDIRVRVVNSGSAFAIHHSDVYQNANFDDVLTKARDFLSAHPTETVLLNLHGECDANTTEGGSGSGSTGHCADDPSNTTTEGRIRVFNSYLARYPGLFYAPTVTGTSAAAMPTLGQVRGRIVLTRFTGPRGQVYSGFGLTQLTSGDWGRYIENDWTQCGLDQKWSRAQANLAEAGNDSSGAMYVTYTSANCAPFGATPADVAGGYGGGTGLNQRTVDYLGGGNSARTGIVMTDFPGHALIAAIIRHQPGGLTGFVPSGLAGKCLDAYNGSGANGTKVELWTCNGSAVQFWTAAPDGSLRINGACLDVAAGSTADGAVVQLWTCHGGTNQRWTQGAGGRLIGAQSGKCLDVPGASTTDGVQLVIWTCQGGANQRWFLR
ncbi:phosphatidylinositol-specific phospholipase C domain-containing protein [Streptomyces sp. NPDC002730]|uniref:phosphatidylinositol-specific phospholipase C domain-containing protein n=1 Tax=Streptomyces sp. NPDC002730 TaxID=3364662 RepID=UPI00369618B5